MFDYTPDGVQKCHSDIAISQLYLINKRLKKINRNLTTLALLGLAFTIFKCKNKLEELKGENRM